MMPQVGDALLNFENTVAIAVADFQLLPKSIILAHHHSRIYTCMHALLLLYVYTFSALLSYCFYFFNSSGLPAIRAVCAPLEFLHKRFFARGTQIPPFLPNFT